MGNVTSAAVKRAEAKVDRTVSKVNSQVNDFMWSPHLAFYIFCYLVLGAALLSGLASAWANDNWNDSQMSYTTYFATSNPLHSNKLVMQVNTGISHSFFMTWFWGGFAVGCFALWLLATLGLIGWVMWGYVAQSEAAHVGYFGRFIEAYFVRWLNYRHVDPIFHITTAFVFVNMWIWLFWSVYVPRDIWIIVFYSIFIVIMRVVFLVAELDNQTILYQVESGAPLTSKGFPVQEHRRGRSGVYFALLLMHMLNWSIVGVYFYKYPSVTRPAFLWGDYFVIVFVEFLIYLTSLLYFYSQSYDLLRSILRLFLKGFFAPFRMVFRSNDKHISDISVKSGVGYVFTAAAYLIFYWTAWTTASQYAFWPPFDW